MFRFAKVFASVTFVAIVALLVAVPAQAAAITYLGIDTTTSGDWYNNPGSSFNGLYGADGYDLLALHTDSAFGNTGSYAVRSFGGAADVISLPSYISSVTVPNTAVWSGNGNCGTMDDPTQPGYQVNTPAVLPLRGGGNITIARSTSAAFNMTILLGVFSDGGFLNNQFTYTLSDGTGTATGNTSILPLGGQPGTPGMAYLNFSVDEGTAPLTLSFGQVTDQLNLAGLAFEPFYIPPPPATFTWNGASSVNWSEPGNWSPAGGPPTTGNAALFNNNVHTAISLGGDQQIGSITFDTANAGAFTFDTNNANTLTLDANSSITVNPTVTKTQTFNCNLALSGGGLITLANNSTSGGNLVINGNVTSAGASGIQILTLGGSGNGSISGSIGDGASGGSVSLTKLGGGTWTLSGNNTYSGGTAISGGTLDIAAAGSLNNTSLVNPVSGGVLTIEGAVTVAPNGAFGVGSGVSGTGTVVVNSGGVLNIGGGSGGRAGRTYIGGKLDGNGALGSGILTLNGGLVNVAAGGSATTGDATNLWLNAYGNGGAAMNLNSGTLSTARTIADGAVAAAPVNFNGGTLQAAGNINLLAGVTANVDAGGAIIDTQSYSASINQALVNGTSGSADGGLTKLGVGTLTLSGSNTYNGGTRVSAGTLAAGSPGALPDYSTSGKVTVAGGAVLAVQTGNGTVGWSSTQIDGLLSSATWSSNTSGLGVNTTNGNFTYGSNITQALSLTKLGANILTLSGANTYTGGTTVNTGTLEAASPGSLPGYSSAGSVSVAGGAVLAVQTGNGTTGWSNTQIDSLRSSATWISNTSSLGINTTNGDFTYGSNITQGLSLTKMGSNTLTLTGANTYTGLTTVNGGTLQLGDGTAGHDGIALTGNIGNNAALVYNLNGTQTYSGIINGSGLLAKAGPGTLTLGANNSYSGPTIITGGTLRLQLPVAAPAIGFVGTQSDMGSGWRTASVAKTFGLTGSLGPNVLGQDGYYVVGASPITQQPSYVTDFSTGSNGIYPGNAGYASIDDPTTTPGGSPTTVTPGTTTFPIGNPVFTFTMGSGAPSTIRLGVMIDGLDIAAYNPAAVYLQQVGNSGLSSPIVATTSPTYNDRNPDWLFFDIVGAAAGSQYGVYGNLGVNGDITLQAFSFDSTNAVFPRILPFSTPISIAGSSTLDLNGVSQQVASLSDYNGSGGTVANNAAGPATLTISSSGGSTTFSGAINGSSSGAISLVMSGSGTQVLAGSITGPGGVTVNSGALYLAGSNSYTGGTVVNGGLLEATMAASLGYNASTSSFAGPITVGSGATLAVPTGGTAGSGWTSDQLTTLVAKTSWSSSTSFLGIDTTNGSATLGGSNALNEPLSLNKLGPNSLTLINASFAGLAISGGTLQLGDGTAGHNSSVPGNILNNSALVYNPSGSQTYSGVISGNGSLTKAGPGTLLLSANNTYSGPTVINGGTLRLLPSVVAGVVYQGTQSDLGSGWRTASVPKTYGLTGGLGTNVLGQDGYYVVGANQRTLQPGYVSDFGTGTNTIYPGNANYASIDDPETTPGSSPSTIVSGTTTLPQSNPIFTFTLGSDIPTTIRLGVMIDGLDGAVWNPSAVYVQDVGDPSLSSGTVATASAIYNDRKPDWLFFDIVGATVGSQFGVFGQGGTNSDVTLQAFSFDSTGTVLQKVLPASTPLLIAANSTLDLNGVSQQVASLSDYNGGGGAVTNSAAGAATLTLSPNGGSMTFSGSIGGTSLGMISLVMNGNGTQVLAGSNTYTGTTTISAGVLQFAGPAALYNSNTASWTPANVTVASGATLAVNVGGPNEFSTTHVSTLLTNLSSASGGGLQAGSIFGFDTTNAPAAVTYPNVIADSANGPLGISKLGSGTLILTGANTYTGPTTISGGTLNLGGTAGYPVVPGNIVNNAALVYNPAGPNTTYAGVISGSGSLIKTGTGSLTISTANTYGGATVISNGTLRLQLGGGVALPDTGDLHLWLDASDVSSLQLSGAHVTQWNDKSGAGNNAVAVNSANAPTYLATGLGGTKPTINMNGSAALLSSFDLNNPNVTIAVIYQNKGGAANGSLFGHDTSGGWHRLQLVATGNGPNSYGAGGYNVAVPGMDSANVNSYVLVSQGGAAGGSSIYLNGSLAAGPFTDNNPNGTNNMSIGDIAPNGGWAGNVDISAVFAYDTALDPTQVTALNAYMNAWIAGTIGQLLPVTTPVTVADSAVFDLGGCTQQIGSLSGAGTVLNSNSATASILTMDSTGGSSTFSGMIKGGGTLGSIGLVLRGSGELVLSGTNTYTGATIVSGGTLVVDSQYALPDGSNLTVGTGASSIFGSAAVGAGSTVSSGAAVSAVPEPGTFVLLIAGLVFGLGTLQKMRKRPE